MTPIEDFINQYNREYDFYQELSRIAANKIEDQLFKRAIKAIVTHRAKRPDRLLEKLEKRNETKQYIQKNDIVKDIVDLAGVRVSLYFPSQRNILDEIVNDIFYVEKKKNFPDEAHTPKYEKRFSGYWASHYRIKLKEDSINQRYMDSLVEIQIASVLMHAWSEVEHDLVYKPHSGALSDDELAILDEINGLVLSGEIALERLHKAMSERTKNKKEISDKYELTNFLINNLTKRHQANFKLGNTFFLNNFLNSTKNRIDTDKFNNYIHNLDINSKETASDQILTMLLYDNSGNVKDILRNYFLNITPSPKKISGFETFVRCWVVLEKAQRELLKTSKQQNKKHFLPDISQLKELDVLTASEIAELANLRIMRNHLLHGVETPAEDILKKNYQLLKKLTKKVIESINDKEIGRQFIQELNEL